MNCPSCGGVLQAAQEATIARCGACQSYSGITRGAPELVATMVPWPAKSREDLEDEADDRAFEAAANAPNPTGKILKFAIPAVVVVTMVVIAISVISTLPSQSPSPSGGTATATAPTKGQTTNPPPKKK